MTRLLLLAALAALVAVLVQWRLLVREAPPDELPPQRPGYYLAGVQLQEYGQDGRLRIGLESERADEDAATGSIGLTDVSVDYHAPAGQRWFLTADRARVPPGGRLVEFEGAVSLTGTPAGQRQVAELRTDRLTLDTVAERAMTKSPVELAFGAHALQSRGMQADLKAGSLRLESDVHGSFNH